MLVGTLDFETFWGNDYTLSKLTTEAYIRDLRFYDHMIGYRLDRLNTDDLSKSVMLDRGWVPHNQIPSLFAKYPANKMAVLAHHAHFDGLIMNHHYGQRPKLWLDTLSMARAVHGQRVGNSLEKLSQYYGLKRKRTEVLDSTKGKERLSSAELARLGEYCLDDIDNTLAIFMEMLPHFSSLELRLIDQTVRMFTEPVMELDVETLRNYAMRLEAERNDLLLSVDCGIDEIMSNDKFAEALKRCGVDPPTKISLTTGKMTWAFAKTDPLFKKLLEHPDDRVQALVTARLGLKTTINQTRTQTLIDMASRGKACVYVRYCGAETTGRDSGADKTNWQNLQRAEYDKVTGKMIPTSGQLRYAVRAPKGKKFVVGDSANIENRALVTLAGQRDAIARFVRKEDPYCFLASRIYAREVTKKDKDERFLGKTATLGLGYQMGAEKFFLTLLSYGIKNLDIRFCGRVVATFRDTYDMVESLWGEGKAALKQMMDPTCNIYFGDYESVHVVMQHNRILLPSGRTIDYPNLRWDDQNKMYVYDGREGKPVKIYGGKVVENVVQALARDVVLEQSDTILRELEKRLPREVWNDMILSGTALPLRVHDEVVLCVDEDYAEITKSIMEEVMSRAPSWWPSLPVACEVGIGTNYRDAKP